MARRSPALIDLCAAAGGTVPTLNAAIMTERYQEQRGQRASTNTFYLLAFGRQLYSNGDNCLAVTAWRFGSPVLNVLTK